MASVSNTYEDHDWNGMKSRGELHWSSYLGHSSCGSLGAKVSVGEMRICPWEVGQKDENLTGILVP